MEYKGTNKIHHAARNSDKLSIVEIYYFMSCIVLIFATY